MKKKYMRVGTSFFKKSLYPTISGQNLEVLLPWSAETIRQDHGKKLISEIENYDGFICFPENRIEHYQKNHLGYYNTYHSMSKVPLEGTIDNIQKFMEHIFGEQVELGFDYLQLLYLKPIQILPILCLISRERSTGKSTFLKFLKEIFEYNMTFLTNSDFTSQFNSDWSSKLIIAIDEVLFKTDELTERIKYLSTTNSHKTEAKGKDKRESNFFGKFILCSNNETSFIKIDSNETRFWVRKIVSYETEDVHFLSKLVNEIPALLFFLTNRKYSTENSSRMWFTPQQIKTNALQKLVKHSCNKIEIELANVFSTIMDSLNLDILQFCFSDVLNFLNKFRLKYDAAEIKKIIRTNWKLEQQSNSNSYQKISVSNDFDFYQNSAKGRYYSITREYLSKNFDDLMTNED